MLWMQLTRTHAEDEDNAASVRNEQRKNGSTSTLTSGQTSCLDTRSHATSAHPHSSLAHTQAYIGTTQTCSIQTQHPHSPLPFTCPYAHEGRTDPSHLPRLCMCTHVGLAPHQTSPASRDRGWGTVDASAKEEETPRQGSRKARRKTQHSICF
jgi:hypothetical protein